MQPHSDKLHPVGDFSAAVASKVTESTARETRHRWGRSEAGPPTNGAGRSALFSDLGFAIFAHSQNERPTNCKMQGISRMRRLIVSVCFLAISPAFAFGQEKPPPPEMQALQSVAMEAIQSRLNWQSQAIALQAQVADLQKQLADANKDKAP